MLSTTATMTPANPIPLNARVAISTVVTSDTAQTIMKSYDAVMQLRPEYANRVSYVISPKGAIVYNYQSLNPSRHVEKTLAALRDWEQARIKP